MANRARIAFLLLGLVLTVGSLAYYAWAEHRASAARGWPQAAGQVLSADIRAEDSTDSDNRTRTVFNPHVTYAYSVAGRAYRGDRIWLNAGISFSDHWKAREFLAPYAPGAEVSVSYNPDDPADAALVIEGAPWQIFIGTAMGLFLLLGGWLIRRLGMDRDWDDMLSERAGFDEEMSGLSRPAGDPGRRSEAHGACRSCGAPLLKDRHRQVEMTGTVTEEYRDEDGRLRVETRPQYVVTHVPCPSCGDPRPLQSRGQKLFAIAFLAFVLTAIAGGSYVIFFL